MKNIDEVLLSEESKWREKQYEEIEKLLGQVICYEVEHQGKSYQSEMHSQRG